MALLYSHQLHEVEPALNHHDHSTETSHRVIIKTPGRLPVAIKVLCHTVGPWRCVTKQTKGCFLYYFPCFVAVGKHIAVDCTPTNFSRT